MPKTAGMFREGMFSFSGASGVCPILYVRGREGFGRQ